MEKYQAALQDIKELLGSTPRGLTISEISKQIGINRNSVAKYLDVLQISGQIERKRVGPAKVFFLSRRIPTSALLNFSSDLMLFLDERLQITEANERLLTYFDMERERLIGQQLTNTILGIPQFLNSASRALEGNSSTFDHELLLLDHQLFLHVKTLPFTSNDGSLGVCLLMEDFSAQHTAEKALKESERRLKNIFFSMSDLVFVFDLQGGIIEYNQPSDAEQLYLPPEEFMGHNYRDFLPEEVAAAMDLALEALQEEGGIQTLEYTLPIGGQKRRFSANITGMRGGMAQIESFLMVIRDITHRFQEELALQLSAQSYRALYEEAPVGYFSVTPEGRIKRVNLKALEMLGYGKGEMSGRSVLDLYAPLPEGREKAERVLARFGEGQATVNEELQMLCQNGETIWISLTVKPLKNEQGEVVESISVVTDISARKASEETIQKMTRQNRLILDSVQEGILGLDLLGLVTFMNHSAAHLLGYEVNELVGRSHHKHAHHTRHDGKPYPLNECPIHASINNGEVHKVVGEVFYTKLGDALPVEYTSKPLKDDEGWIFGTVVIFRQV